MLEAAAFAAEQGYGSMVIQGGERTDRKFIGKITSLLVEIKRRWPLGITLSLGEQTEDVYREWFEAGAHRYLRRSILWTQFIIMRRECRLSGICASAAIRWVPEL